MPVDAAKAPAPGPQRLARLRCFLLHAGTAGLAHHRVGEDALRAPLHAIAAELGRRHGLAPGAAHRRHRGNVANSRLLLRLGLRVGAFRGRVNLGRRAAAVVRRAAVLVPAAARDRGALAVALGALGALGARQLYLAAQRQASTRSVISSGSSGAGAAAGAHEGGPSSPSEPRGSRPPARAPPSRAAGEAGMLIEYIGWRMDL